jgi:hypothetical protein
MFPQFLNVEGLKDEGWTSLGEEEILSIYTGSACGSR